MKHVVLISMPDIAPVIIHEMAIHMPNLGIAAVGGNIDRNHRVHTIDLIRKRRGVRRYLTRTLNRLQPDIVGLSAMAWQYPTCVRIIDLIRRLLPDVKIAIGGYHATLMAEEIAASPEAGQIDFMIRGEGEDAFRRLVNALDGDGQLGEIPSLSYRQNGRFIHNPPGDLLDLSTLGLPIRDRRRLTWGYHVMYNPIEVMETSRGCTRSCNFCSIRHMYGKSFRTYPLDRVIADIDDIYYNRKTRWIFIADDNMVLDPDWVMTVSEAVIRQGYRRLNLVVQADCLAMAKNEPMVRLMARAGVKSVFLGIENVSSKNLARAHKGNTAAISRKAVENCHKHGIMVIGGLVLGFPDDDDRSIIENYEFFNSLGVDGAYCQILTPYPKTGIRRDLMAEGLVTNPHRYETYNGLWANLRTHHLTADELQYAFWYHKQTVLGWWNPSELVRRDGKLWTDIWRVAFKPVLKFFIDRQLRKDGWDGRYRAELERLSRMNRFPDLEI